MTPTDQFAPEEILEALVTGGVQFVVVGGIAATLHGSPYPTLDVDTTPDKSHNNLERLVNVLRDLGAQEWKPHRDEFLDREWSAEMLAVDKVWLLMTKHGPLDLVFEPSGSSGYGDLVKKAVPYQIGKVEVLVASIEDLIRIKAATDRERDRMQLPTLRKLLERSRMKEDGGSDL